MTENDARKITAFEERVFRYCHHNFVGLTQQEAAIRLHVSQKKISRTLSRLKKRFPQFFPILTRNQATVHRYITKWGLTHQQIAIIMGVSKATVNSTVVAMTTKGMHFTQPCRTVRYEVWHDKNIQQKF